MEPLARHAIDQALAGSAEAVPAKNPGTKAPPKSKDGGRS